MCVGGGGGGLEGERLEGMVYIYAFMITKREIIVNRDNFVVLWLKVL